MLLGYLLVIATLEPQPQSAVL